MYRLKSAKASIGIFQWTPLFLNYPLYILYPQNPFVFSFSNMPVDSLKRIYFVGNPTYPENPRTAYNPDSYLSCPHETASA